MHRDDVVAPVAISAKHCNTPSILDLKEDTPYISLSRFEPGTDPATKVLRQISQNLLLDWLDMPLQNTLVLRSRPPKHRHIETTKMPELLRQDHPMLRHLPLKNRQLVLVPDSSGNAVRS